MTSLKSKKTQKNSLASKIAEAVGSVPAEFGSDDEDFDSTRAKLTSVEDSTDEDEAILSKIRTDAADLLGDIDTRYAGKKGSRKRLRQESLSSDEGSEDDEEEDEASLEAGNQTAEEDDVQTDEQLSEEEDTEDEEEEEEDFDSDDNENEEPKDTVSDQSDVEFQHVRKTNISEETKKGQCVRNQLLMWENLIEMRIQLQKCLVAANKLPQKSHFEEIATESEFKTKVKETQNNLKTMLDKMLSLQSIVIKKYPETKTLQAGNSYQENEDDEEIPSDTDDEIQEHETDNGNKESGSPKPKRRKLNDYEKDISELHSKYTSYRNRTLDVWNTKTRFSVTKNSGQSIVNQIENILADKNKLRRKTQLQRTDYRILGQNKDDEQINEQDDKEIDKYNVEIFDDSDFYHQMLRELIVAKSADVTDPVLLSRQWIQVHDLRNKMKRKVDTRATKGRKIRYTVVEKMVSYWPHYNESSLTESAIDNLYNSVHGKGQPK